LVRLLVIRTRGALPTFAKLAGSGLHFFQTSIEKYLLWRREKRRRD
jgi:hypothetical protein